MSRISGIDSLITCHWVCGRNASSAAGAYRSASAASCAARALFDAAIDASRAAVIAASVASDFGEFARESSGVERVSGFFVGGVYFENAEAVRPRKLVIFGVKHCAVLL